MLASLRAPSDLLDESILSMNEARDIYPGRPSLQKLNRLRLKGVLVGGTRVKLETFRDGSTVYTSREAIRRFIDRISCPGDTTAQYTTAERRSAHQRAVAELEREGL